MKGIQLHPGFCLKTILLFLVVWFMAPMPLHAQEGGEPSRIPSLIRAIRVNPPVYFCGEEVPVHIPDIRHRLERELLLYLGNRAQVILWLKRMPRYMGYIEKRLIENNIPLDMKYMAVVESALLPHIGSSKYAIGYWQFLQSTGRKYGLAINRHIDERRNIFKSTDAAVRYMKDLYDRFGNWALVAAAYNMGESGLERRIEEQETADFYDLYLPLETQQHIMRIIAVKIILENPEKFGFYMEEKDYYPPLEFDSITLKCASRTPLLLVAKAADTTFKDIKDLNPDIRGKNLESGTHYLLIPKGRAKEFASQYKRVYRKWISGKNISKKEKKSFTHKTKKSYKEVYIVKEGDSLSTIAKRMDVSLHSLLSWNRLNPNNPIYPGQRLILFRE